MVKNVRRYMILYVSTTCKFHFNYQTNVENERIKKGNYVLLSTSKNVVTPTVLQMYVARILLSHVCSERIGKAECTT